jgi:hypothetical protein
MVAAAVILRRRAEKALAAQQAGLKGDPGATSALEWYEQWQERAGKGAVQSSQQRIEQLAVEAQAGDRRLGGAGGVDPRTGRARPRPQAPTQRELQRAQALTHAAQQREFGRVIADTRPKPLTSTQQRRARSFTEAEQQRRFGRVAFRQRVVTQRKAPFATQQIQIDPELYRRYEQAVREGKGVPEEVTIPYAFVPDIEKVEPVVLEEQLAPPRRISPQETMQPPVQIVPKGKIVPKEQFAPSRPIGFQETMRPKLDPQRPFKEPAPLFKTFAEQEVFKKQQEKVFGEQRLQLPPTREEQAKRFAVEPEIDIGIQRKAGEVTGLFTALAGEARKEREKIKIATIREDIAAGRKQRAIDFNRLFGTAKFGAFGVGLGAAAFVGRTVTRPVETAIEFAPYIAAGAIGGAPGVGLFIGGKSAIQMARGKETDIQKLTTGFATRPFETTGQIAGAALVGAGVGKGIRALKPSVKTVTIDGKKVRLIRTPFGKPGVKRVIETPEGVTVFGRAPKGKIGRAARKAIIEAGELPPATITGEQFFGVTDITAVRKAPSLITTPGITISQKKAPILPGMLRKEVIEVKKIVTPKPSVTIAETEKSFTTVIGGVQRTTTRLSKGRTLITERDIRTGVTKTKILGKGEKVLGDVVTVQEPSVKFTEEILDVGRKEQVIQPDFTREFTVRKFARKPIAAKELPFGVVPKGEAVLGVTEKLVAETIRPKTKIKFTPTGEVEQFFITPTKFEFVRRPVFERPPKIQELFKTGEVGVKLPTRAGVEQITQVAGAPFKIEFVTPSEKVIPKAKPLKPKGVFFEAEIRERLGKKSLQDKLFEATTRSDKQLRDIARKESERLARTTKPTGLGGQFQAQQTIKRLRAEKEQAMFVEAAPEYVPPPPSPFATSEDILKGVGEQFRPTDISDTLAGIIGVRRAKPREVKPTVGRVQVGVTPTVVKERKDLFSQEFFRVQIPTQAQIPVTKVIQERKMARQPVSKLRKDVKVEQLQRQAVQQMTKIVQPTGVPFTGITPPPIPEPVPVPPPAFFPPSLPERKIPKRKKRLPALAPLPFRPSYTPTLIGLEFQKPVRGIEGLGERAYDPFTPRPLAIPVRKRRKKKIKKGRRR